MRETFTAMENSSDWKHITSYFLYFFIPFVCSRESIERFCWNLLSFAYNLGHFANTLVVDDDDV